MTHEIIAVDFDGTIVEHEYPNIGPERPGAIQTLIDLRNAGHKLILWTCRDGDDLAKAFHWCVARGMSFDAINCNLSTLMTFATSKVLATYYFDDRSFPAFPGWDAVRKYFELDKEETEDDR